VFAGANTDDTILTTWHATETLDEAPDFFINFAQPTDRLDPTAGTGLQYR
jgi:hypothetical protein